MKNKIFITIFFILLIAPTIVWLILEERIGVNNSENRALAEMPTINSLEDVEQFPKLYESYYNDHLPFKDVVVRYNSLLNYELFNIVDSKKVLLGKDEWLFYKTADVPELADELPISDYMGINRYDNETKKSLAENINIVENYLKTRDIKFLVMICPNKESIYSEYLPKGIKEVSTNKKVDDLIDFLYINTDVPLIYPYDDLMEYKDKYQLYYKYDTHWNKLGGFVAEQKIRKELLGYEENIDMYHINDLGNVAPKDLAVMLNMQNVFVNDSEYIIEDYLNNVEVNITKNEQDEMIKVYESDSENDITVMVIRDSYGVAMMDYMAKDFKKVIFVHRGIFTEQYIEEYNPDYIVYQTVERATDDMLNLSNMFGLQ